MLALLLVVAIVARSGSVSATRIWRGIVQQRVAVGFLFGVVLFIVAFATYLVRIQAEGSLANRELRDFGSPSNLISTSFLPVAPLTHTVEPLPPPHEGDKDNLLHNRDTTILGRGTVVATNVIIVQPEQSYRFTFRTIAGSNGTNPQVQVRQLWFDPGLNIVSFRDSETFGPTSFGDTDS